MRAMWWFPCPDWSVRVAGRAEAAGPDSGVDRHTAARDKFPDRQQIGLRGREMTAQKPDSYLPGALPPAADPEGSWTIPLRHPGPDNEETWESAELERQQSGSEQPLEDDRG